MRTGTTTTPQVHAVIDLRVLGPLEVLLDDRPARLARAKERALLALLVVHCGEVVTAERLIEALWAHAPPSARGSLQTLVSRLRHVLGDSAPITSLAHGYMLQPEPGSVDAHRFATLVADGRAALNAGDPQRARRLIGAGLELWRGPAYADVAADDDDARAEAARLDELRLVALEERVEADLALGNHAACVGELTALVARHPLRERLHGQLMLALYRSGQQGEALAAYQHLRAVLVEELGIDPSPELQRLEEAVLLQAPELEWRRPLRLAEPVASARVDAVARPLTSFVGREQELARVELLLDGARLVTLTGPGGVGKTRLAYEVASRQSPRRGARVWVVELDAVAQDASVVAVVAGTLGVREQPARPLADTLTEHLAGEDALLVLDNCEHLLDGCAVLAERLLRGCPQLQVLATSREPLRAAGEVAWSVPPLSLPDAGHNGAPRRSEAVTLFLDRVRVAAPQRELPPADEPAIAQLCRRLDGMPLALELAAACTRVLPVAEVARRLDDRFHLLVAGSRTAAPRHQSLRATVDWSWQLLGPAERRMLARVGVFAGRFSADAAESVCAGDGIARADVLPLLSRLAEASLVVVEERGDPLEPRRPGVQYRLLETLRTYGCERLAASGEEDRLRARHAAFYTAEAERAAAGLRGPDAAAWLDRLEADHGQLRAALAWTFDAAEASQALRLAAALWRYAYLRGHYAEGRAWLDAALAGAAGQPDEVVAPALHGAGALAFYQCDYRAAAEQCTRALVCFRSLHDLRGAAETQTVLGAIARERGDYERALQLHRDAGDAFMALDDHWGVAHSLQMSAFASWLSGDASRAAELSGRALALFEQLGDRERQAWALLDLGAVALCRGDLASAVPHLEDSRARSVELGFKEGVAWALNLLGLAALRSGNLTRAAALLRESVELHRGLGDRWRTASVLEALAGVALADGDAAHAARLLGRAAHLREVIGAPVPACERADHAAVSTATRAALAEPVLARFLAEGRAASAADAPLDD